MTNTTLQQAIAAAREKLGLIKMPEPTYGQQVIAAAQEKINKATGLTLNEKQQSAVTLGITGKSFCLIGSAGTGKTTTLKAVVGALMASNKIPPLESGSKHLVKGAPGIALIAYTRRAVRNIAKNMSADFKSHCMTFHSLVEYEPEELETYMPNGDIKISKPFRPQKRQGNKLPANLSVVIIDESSMFSVDFFKILCEALHDPSQVQFIFLGDLNQLPPIYGDGVLGLQLNRLPIVELTEVYRQALESPIIKYALAIKDNNLPKELRVLTKDYVEETSQGKVTFRPWKRKLDMEDAGFAMNKELTSWVDKDLINFETDIILCPWGKKFGTIEMNKTVATALARKHGREVYEIIAGFNKHYYSVGDRIMVNKMDAIVTKISRNIRFLGKPPQPHSATMDYWGWGGSASNIHDELSADELLDALGSMDEVQDRVAQASHVMHYRFPGLDADIPDSECSTAAEFNSMDLAYAMSIHKSQGSEWERVFVITHDCHAKMLLRELIYTAFTRASKELYVIMSPTMLQNAASRAKIKGATLEDKIKWFKTKLTEKGEVFDNDDSDD